MPVGCEYRDTTDRPTAAQRHSHSGMHQGHVGSLAGIIQIQECLLCLTRGIACVIDTAEHALERRLVWSEREYTSVGGQLEVRVAVHIRDGAEREGHLEEAEEELVEVLSRKGVRVNADDAVGALPMRLSSDHWQRYSLVYWSTKQ